MMSPPSRRPKFRKLRFLMIADTNVAADPNSISCLHFCTYRAGSFCAFALIGEMLRTPQGRSAVDAHVEFSGLLTFMGMTGHNWRQKSEAGTVELCACSSALPQVGYPRAYTMQFPREPLFDVRVASAAGTQQHKGDYSGPDQQHGAWLWNRIEQKTLWKGSVRSNDFANIINTQSEGVGGARERKCKKAASRAFESIAESADNVFSHDLPRIVDVEALGTSRVRSGYYKAGDRTPRVNLAREATAGHSPGQGPGIVYSDFLVSELWNRHKLVGTA
jgi:hypothetical protein